MAKEGISIKPFKKREWSLPLDINQVAEATGAFGVILAESGWTDDPSAMTDMEVGFDEALANAVKHGNKNDPNKKVHVKIEASKDRVCVKIRDEGDGFKIEEVPNPINIENLEKTSGRGILFMRHYFDSITYNDKGNEVTLIKERKKY